MVAEGFFFVLRKVMAWAYLGGGVLVLVEGGEVLGSRRGGGVLVLGGVAMCSGLGGRVTSWGRRESGGEGATPWGGERGACFVLMKEDCFNLSS